MVPNAADYMGTAANRRHSTFKEAPMCGQCDLKKRPVASAAPPVGTPPTVEVSPEAREYIARRGGVVSLWQRLQAGCG